MLAPVFKLVRNDITPTLRKFSAEMKKGMREVTRQAARGITRRLLEITPPASEGVSGLDARRAGENKITGQMRRILAPKNLKGRRKITHVFGRKLKRPVYVQTKEKYPDVAALYRDNTRFRTIGAGVTTRKVANKFYVSATKFKAEQRSRHGQVGKFASGWAPGAAALDVPVQNWISRHGASNGMVRVDTAGDRMRVVVENFAPGTPANLRDDMARRIPYAVQYQADAMTRAIEGMNNRIAGELGIKQSN
jgi:hypothetical protein